MHGMKRNSWKNEIIGQWHQDDTWETPGGWMRDGSTSEPGDGRAMELSVPVVMTKSLPGDQSGGTG